MKLLLYKLVRFSGMVLLAAGLASAEASAERLSAAPDQTTTYHYVNRLYDLFQKKNGQLIKLTERSSFVAMPVKITWVSDQKVKKFFIQHSQTPGFEKVIAYESKKPELTLPSVFLGENNWRVSTDGKTWDLTQKFTVDKGPPDVAIPKMKAKDADITLADGKALAELEVQAEPSLTHFVIEIAHNPAFTEVPAEISWTSKKKILWKVTEPGDLYFRIRGVTAKDEVTKFSEPTKVTVSPPPPSP